MDFLWTVLLVIIIYCDVKEKRIPDVLTVSVFICALLRIIMHVGPEIGESLIGAAAGGLLFFLLLLWKPGAFGGGDVKLSVSNGMYLGAGRFFYSFAAAVFLAGIYIVIGISLKRIERKSEIAFGPFLCAGAILARYIL